MAIFKQIQLGAIPRNVVTTINNNFNKLYIPAHTLTTVKAGDIEKGTDIGNMPINTIIMKLLTGANGLVSKEAMTAAMGGNEVVTQDKLGQPGGIATLTEEGKLTEAQIPDTVPNATKFDGKTTDYFASATDLQNKANELDNRITAAVNAMEWRPSVADLAAMKGITTPKEGWTLSLEDTNQVFRFDAQSSASVDEGDKVIVPNDGTTGAWIRLGTTVYSNATADADGLMAAEDKANLDKLVAAEVPGLKDRADKLEEKFDENGSAKDALSLGGKAAKDYVTKAQLEAQTAGQFAIKTLYIQEPQFVAGTTLDPDAGEDAQTFAAFTLPAADPVCYRVPMSALRKNDDGTFEQFLPVVRLGGNGQDITIMMEEAADVIITFAEIKVADSVPNPTSPAPVAVGI